MDDYDLDSQYEKYSKFLNYLVIFINNHNNCKFADRQFGPYGSTALRGRC